MFQARKPGLKLGRSKINTFFQHCPIKLSEFSRITLFSIFKTINRTIGEEKPEHTTNMSSRNRVPGLFSRIYNTPDKLTRYFVQVLIRPRFLKSFEGVNPGGHG
ncbi:hypothetical protein HanIR_Chr02g0055431 [Helianthus annuus]|nr:hypothetical protein HanIR_Chr02g0055431 [Helianthus annuus]